MPIPTNQALYRPELEALASGASSLKEVTKLLADKLALTESERAERVPSGTNRFLNRVSWSIKHLREAGLVEIPKPGQTRLTDEGKKVLVENPAKIDNSFLKRYAAYLDYINSAKSVANTAQPVENAASANETPEEVIEAAADALNQSVKDELLTRLKACTPAFFEVIVVRVLIALGYGTVGDSFVTGKPGDGDVDGIIYEDKLGLDVVCVQAKRWLNPVGRPEVQSFVGSMDMHGSKKGVVISTSQFTPDACKYIDMIEAKKVVLIGGKQLVELMVDNNVGVTIKAQFQIKEISNDFFDDEAL